MKTEQEIKARYERIKKMVEGMDEEDLEFDEMEAMVVALGWVLGVNRGLPDVNIWKCEPSEPQEAVASESEASVVGRATISVDGDVAAVGAEDVEALDRIMRKIGFAEFKIFGIGPGLGDRQIVMEFEGSGVDATTIE